MSGQAVNDFEIGSSLPIQLHSFVLSVHSAVPLGDLPPFFQDFPDRSTPSFVRYQTPQHGQMIRAAFNKRQAQVKGECRFAHHR